jgi:uncharacterized protein
MGKKKISRKDFVAISLGGIAGINLISDNLYAAGFTVSDKRRIGKTDIFVSPLCFGATRTNDLSLIKYVLDKGITFIDTGRAYSNGNNERLVGQALLGIRKNIIIQSKIQLQENELPSKGKGKKGADEIRGILSAKLEESLKALNTDYIDIMLYHSAVKENLLFHPEVLKFFSEMKSKGVLKACGFSTHNENMNLPERNNSERVYDTIMVPFNHKGSFVHSVTSEYSEWDQKRLISVLTEAKKNGIGVVAMKTCSGGKYSPSPGIEPSFKEAVKWVISQEYISAAAVAIANFEQADEFTS